MTAKTQQDLQQVIAERGNLENKIAMLSTEIERFQYRLNNKQEECTLLNIKLQELQQQLLQLQELPSEIEGLKSQLSQLQEEWKALEAKNVKLQ